jgi:hypothetical protein
MAMCRFQSKDDEGYKQVVGEIQMLMFEIQRRREQVALEKGIELANVKTGSPSQTTTASATYCT